MFDRVAHIRHGVTYMYGLGLQEWFEESLKAEISYAERRELV